MRLKDFVKKYILFSPVALTVISALVVGGLLLVADLKPHVDNDFFFSGDSPQFKSEEKIAEMFPQYSQIIISAKGDIYSETYLRRIEQLTKELMSLDHITGVKSLIDGPGDADTAIKSPLWKRLLVSDDEGSSNIIVFLEDVPAEEIIPKLENAVWYFNAPYFELKIAGVAYVVELIRRNLVRDLIVFSSAAFIIFAIVIFVIFKSFRILIGTLVTCVDACVITLVVSQLLKAKIGILTANLFTIVFVLTLSHIVFITNNWRRIKSEGGRDSYQAARLAARQTFKASFWCMVTTLLGFVSLVFVQAAPLQELGVSGSVGAFIAIVIAYTVYPLFLCSVKSTHRRVPNVAKNKTVFVGHYMWAAVVVAFTAGFCIPGLQKIDTDPSLFEYFKKGGELRNGLEYIDRNGGSSPLNLVISDFYDEKLNTSDAYKRLWELQMEFEKDPDAGSVISLPVLLAEGKRNPFAFFITLEGLLRIMEDPKYDRIANTFVTKDRRHAHFFLRMRETQRTVPRLEVVERIKNAVYKHNFKPQMVGGVYVLQGELSKMVAISLVAGLVKLVMLFMIIAYVISRSIKTTLAMVGCLSVIPVCMMGIIGHFKIPLDIISAPAANVAIGMGIDSMIHMVVTMKRYLSEENSFWQAWQRARMELWQPIVSSMCIIGAGFGIFAFSMFPPNQRFGMAVVFGTILAAPVALFVLPSVVGPWFYRD
ncbi:MAG: MMPL family transporter [Candidatus Omnitrophica bacterium]|nr:MMPL family transporter [Candidatus Omnitrophota bacterium]